jgi:hypothetical protein
MDGVRLACSLATRCHPKDPHSHRSGTCRFRQVQMMCSGVSRYQLKTWIADSFYSVFTGCVLASSPASQPIARGSFNGSGRSQSRHRNVRSPRAARRQSKVKKATQPVQVGRQACPMPVFSR